MPFETTRVNVSLRIRMDSDSVSTNVSIDWDEYISLECIRFVLSFIL